MKIALSDKLSGVADKYIFNNVLAWVILIIALSFTVAYAFYVSLSVKEKAQTTLMVESNQIIARIDTRLKSHAQLLRTGAAFFEASDTVTRTDWHTFIDHQLIDENMPGVMGVGYAMLVQAEALKKFEEHIRMEGFGNFSVFPSGLREFYTSVIYIEPFTGSNQQTIGLDMYSNPIHRAAMDSARDLCSASLTGIAPLARSESGEQSDAVLFVPVYFREMPLITLADRKSAIKGWVFSPYKISTLMEGILKNYEQNEASRIYLQIYDGRTIAQKSLMYDSGMGKQKNADEYYSLNVQLPYSFNGTRWTLNFRQARPSNLLYFDQKVGWVLVVGFVISILFFLLAISLLNSHQRLKDSIRLASTIQQRLDKLIALYKAIPDALFVSDNKTGQIEEINNRAAEQYGYEQHELKGMYLSNISLKVGQLGFPETTGQLFAHDTYHQKKDGSIFPVEISSSSFVVDGAAKMISVARDISERLKVEADLRIKDEVFENSMAALCITDKAGLVTHANKAFQLMWAFHSISDVQNRTFNSLLVNKSEAQHIIETLNNTGFWQGEYLAKKQDGSTFIARGLATILLNKQGEIIGYQSTNIDITIEKGNEDRLLEYKTAIDQATDGIAIVDMDRRIRFLNQSWFKMHGYSADELPDYDMQHFHTENQLFEEVEPLFANMFNNGYYSGEVGHRRKNGSVFPTWMSATVLKDIHDNPVGYLGVIQDITLKKAAESELQISKLHYQTLVENANDAIVVTISDKVVFANSRFFEIFALTELGVLPLNLMELIHPEDVESLKENYLQLYKGKKLQKCQSRFITSIGQTKWAEFSAVVIDWDGQAAVIHFIDDVTERKISADALKATLKEKEILLREVHHRVKNNLQVVSSLLNLQSNRITDQAIKHLLSQSRNRIRSIALVHEKLYQSGNFAEINLKEYSLSLLSELFRLNISDPEKIKIRAEIEDINIPLIYAIPCGLILNEIISNSLKYAFPENREFVDKPEIYICFKTLPNNNLQLSAGDNGIGLPEDYQLTGSSSLGLYLIHILATEQLDGKLEIDTKKGSNFTITFNSGLKT
jgi:PAS domain S-box-containing protein